MRILSECNVCTVPILHFLSKQAVVPLWLLNNISKCVVTVEHWLKPVLLIIINSTAKKNNNNNSKIKFIDYDMTKPTADQLLTGDSRDQSEWSEDSECTQSFHVEATTFFSHWTFHATYVVNSIHNHSEQPGEIHSQHMIFYLIRCLLEWLFPTLKVTNCKKQWTSVLSCYWQMPKCFCFIGKFQFP